MDKNTINLDEAKNNNSNSIGHDDGAVAQTSTINPDNQNIVNDDIQITVVDPKATETVKRYKTTTTHGPSSTKTIRNKKKSPKDSHNVDINISAQLRKEISGFDKLPPYKERSRKGFGRYIGKHSKAYGYLREKIRNSCAPRNVLVHFSVMGSETIPEDKVLMVYEPETRNYTVKGMFVILMILHFFTCLFTIYFYVSDMYWMFKYEGHLTFMPPLFLLIGMAVSMACYQYMRKACCVSTATILAFIFYTLFYASLSGYFSTRIFIFINMAMGLTDIVLVSMGCRNFDYTTKKLYIVALGSGAVFLMMVIPMMESFGRRCSSNWALAPHDHIETYILCYFITIPSIGIIVAELQLLISGEHVEIGEDDYLFGGFLLYVSLIDFPIRMCRKLGACNCCDQGGEESE